MSLTLTQIKFCADYIDTLKELIKSYEELGLGDTESVKIMQEQIPVWQENLEFWEKEALL